MIFRSIHLCKKNYALFAIDLVGSDDQSIPLEPLDGEEQEDFQQKRCLLIIDFPTKQGTRILL